MDSYLENPSQWKFLAQNRRIHPNFFLRPARYGYEFGITVVPEWWSEHRKSLSAQIGDLAVGYDETIVLAFLPNGYFPEFVRQWNESIDWSTWERLLKTNRRWEAKLAKHGWITTADQPDYVHHRYLAIGYRDL